MAARFGSLHCLMCRCSHQAKENQVALPDLPRVETVSIGCGSQSDIHHRILEGYGHEHVNRDDFDLRQLGLG